MAVLVAPDPGSGGVGFGSSSPTLPATNSNAGARLHSFTSRSLSYSGGVGSSSPSGSGSALGIAGASSRAAVASGGGLGGNPSDPAVKEVDDPTTPVNVFGGGSSAPNTFSRLFSTPTPQAHGQSGRSYSYRGSRYVLFVVSGD